MRGFMEGLLVVESMVDESPDNTLSVNGSSLGQSSEDALLVTRSCAVKLNVDELDSEGPPEDGICADDWKVCGLPE